MMMNASVSACSDVQSSVGAEMAVIDMTSYN